MLSIGGCQVKNGGTVDIIVSKFLDFNRFKPKLHVKF